MFRTETERIVRENMIKNGMLHLHELEQSTGISPRMLCTRMAKPETLRLFELRSIASALNMSGEDVLRIVLGGAANDKAD